MHRRTDGAVMDLGDILSKDQIITELQASNRWEAIDELIQNLVKTGKIKAENHDAISAVVKKRENSMSTGIGFGIGPVPAVRKVLDGSLRRLSDSGQLQASFRSPRKS